MKIAVYTIALNEEKFVERWATSAKDANYLLIADTGSTDRTVEIARQHNVNTVSIGISPWRFDDARNAALASLPIDVDYCIALDMDEVLIDGWREELEKALEQGATRPRYKYTWSWNPDGTPGLQYGGDKIHARKGYRWKHPVHEVITSDRIDEVQHWVGLEIHHHPDSTKSRGQYFPLLELSVREDPTDDRNAFYYARELFYHSRFQEAAVEFRRHLSLPTARWNAERAASMRFLAKCESENTEQWLLQAISEDPNRREALVELALHHYSQEKWEECLNYAEQALSIDNKPLDYLCEAFAWGSQPYDLAAIASYHLGNKENALNYGTLALVNNPEDSRLASNLEWYKSK
jgi:glycosyltransferase involved in cell wall biosynthesis